MKAQLILVPVDFTPMSEAALDAAATLARGSGGRLLIVHVRESAALAGTHEHPYDDSRCTTAELTKKLSAVVPPETGVACEHRLLEGSPVDAILSTAESTKADVIVLGTHGRRGVAGLLMGSVAEAVVRRAKCPVLAVKAEAAVAVAAR